MCNTIEQQFDLNKKDRKLHGILCGETKKGCPICLATGKTLKDVKSAVIKAAKRLQTHPFLDVFRATSGGGGLSRFGVILTKWQSCLVWANTPEEAEAKILIAAAVESREAAKANE